MPRADEASSFVPAGPFRDFSSAVGDQKLRILGRHLERATRAHVEVPVWTGLHGPGAGRWTKMDRLLLGGTDFTGAHLQAATLIGAIAERACFDRADLSRGQPHLQAGGLRSSQYSNLIWTQQIPYAERTHSEGTGCARWSATSFLRRACSSALIEAGSSRNSGPMAMAFLTAGRSLISSSQRFTFGNSSMSIFRVAQLDAQG